jgi:hypothetical protein
MAALSVFEDRAHPPVEADLAGALGKSHASWKDLIAHMQEVHGTLAEEWNFAGPKFGWSLRLREKKRVALYLIPGSKSFLVGIVLGEKAVAEARRADIPDAIKDMIEAARAYAEGRGIRIEVRTRKDLDPIRKLAAIKLAK